MLMTTLFLDADALPTLRDAVSIGLSHRVPVVVVANASQNLARYAGKQGVEVLQAGPGPDAADFAIISRLGPDDVVVTQDIGLAAMVLGRGARALSPRGRVFSTYTIDAEMALRHAEQRHRRMGGRTRGPSRFEEADREHFRESLTGLLRPPAT
jgi:uncharacterized protein YaiI (UPF0178 family)